MLFRWHGIVGSVGIIGAVAAPGMIAERWVSGGSAEATAPRRVAVVDSLSAPEAVSYDSTGVHSSAGGTLEHRGPDRILRVSRMGQVTVALQSAALDEPDGIAWNARGRAFLLAPIGGQALQTWKPGQRAPVNLPRGAGKFGGIEVEPDGRAFVTSWADSSVFQLHGTQLHRSIGPLDAPPADISLDQRNGDGSRLPHREPLRTVDAI